MPFGIEITNIFKGKLLNDLVNVNDLFQIALKVLLKAFPPLSVNIKKIFLDKPPKTILVMYIPVLIVVIKVEVKIGMYAGSDFNFIFNPVSLSMGISGSAEASFYGLLEAGVINLYYLSTFIYPLIYFRLTYLL